MINATPIDEGHKSLEKVYTCVPIAIPITIKMMKISTAYSIKVDIANSSRKPCPSIDVGIDEGKEVGRNEGKEVGKDEGGEVGKDVVGAHVGMLVGVK